MGRKYWSTEDHDLMMKLLAEGKSCRVVGETLGVTRNAVIGRAHRFKVKVSHINGRPQGSPKMTAWRKKPKLQLYDFSEGKRPVMVSKPKKFAVVRKRTVRPPEDSPHKCLFAVLDRKKCHWPLWADDGTGERFYCGAPVEGKTYCEGHWTAATEPSKARYVRRDPSKPFVIINRPAKPPKSMVV